MDLYSVRGRLLLHDMVKYWQIFHGSCVILTDDMFASTPLDTTRGHRYKVAHVRAEIEIRKRFFSVRGILLWNSLPQHVVTANTESAFKLQSIPLCSSRWQTFWILVYYNFFIFTIYVAAYDAQFQLLSINVYTCIWLCRVRGAGASAECGFHWSLELLNRALGSPPGESEEKETMFRNR